MAQEDKELLLKDLSARLSYEVVVNMDKQFDMIPSAIDVVSGEVWDYMHENGYSLEQFDIKPYLRPMSSMTEEEEEEFKQVIELELKHLESEELGHTIISAASSAFEIDFYNKHHFDYRGLIPMGLALKAPDGMY